MARCIASRRNLNVRGGLNNPPHESNATQPLSIAELSDREIEVFQLIGSGLNSREIAERLHLGTSTIDSYRARIKEKLGIKNAAELYQRAAQWLVENNL